MTHLDLFSGIGGFALAVDTVWPGSEHIFCEIDPFCQNVLKKHWPNATIYGDIRTITNVPSGRQREGKQEGGGGGESETSTRGRSGNVDLLTGGFPCQPFSQAGKRKGEGDDRYLWPEMLRVVREFHPTWIIGENVAGIINMALEQVCLDLEGEGYEVQPFVIPACAVNAPHRRDRVWIVAHSINHRQGREKRGSLEKKNRVSKEYRTQNSATGELVGTDSNREAIQPITNTKGQRGRRIASKERRANQRKVEQEKQSGCSIRSESEGRFGVDWNRYWQEVAFATCDVRVDDGLPKRLVRLPDGSTITEAKWRQQALKGYGNAIVPQVAIEIMHAISEQ